RSAASSTWPAGSASSTPEASRRRAHNLPKTFTTRLLASRRGRFTVATMRSFGWLRLLVVQLAPAAALPVGLGLVAAGIGRGAGQFLSGAIVAAAVAAWFGVRLLGDLIRRARSVAEVQPA